MVSTILLLIGVFFVFLGMLGLLRLPDVYNRLHATTKIGTLGVVSVMLSILIKVGLSPIGVKGITVGLFLFLTAPIAAHMIGRAAHRHGVGLCQGSVIDEYGKDCEKESCPIGNLKTDSE